MYLAIDYGKKRIGLAVGQAIPKGIGFIDGTKSFDLISSEIKKICDDNEVKGIVIGLPVWSGGEEGGMAKEIKSFAGRLEKSIGLPIYFEPEQYTSEEAEEILKESNKHYPRKSGKVDELAAEIILEQFLSGRIDG